MSDSPARIIYGSDGSTYIEVTRRPGVAIPSSAPGLLGMGSDGAKARYLSVNSAGALNISTPIDAFGRTAVAQPETLFDGKLLYDAAPLVWDDQQTAGGSTSSTYNANQASVTLAVASLTAGTRVRQTFERFPYQAGKSQGFAMTGILGTPAVGITRRLGAFDGNNGIFFESAPSGVRVVRRTKTSGSPVDNAVAQANWNVDKMDGAGISGITLDFSKVQIFEMQFQWLGVGSIWFGVNIGGTPYWVHRMDVANSLTTVSMSTPNLPLRYEIANDGTGGVASILQICSTVFSGGGVAEIGARRALYRAGFATLNDGNWYPLIAVRLGSAYLGAHVHVHKVSLNCQSTADYTWRLVLNPTIVGTALGYSAVANSGVEAALASTNATTITGGVDIDAECTQQSTGSAPAIGAPGEITLGSTIAGVSDVLVLAVRRDSGTTETFNASLVYSEQP